MKKFFNMNLLIIFLTIICYNKLFCGEIFFAKIDVKEKIVFLTFDDGPGPWTKDILNLLKKYDVKATFFVLGELVKYRVDTVKEIYSNGNEIGTHLFIHKNFYQVQKNIIWKKQKNF